MANTEKDAKFAEKVEANIAQLDIGKDAKVEIKLKDGKKLNGYLSEVKESSFVLTSDDNGMSEESQYAQVKQVKGKNSKRGKRIRRSIFVIGAIVLYGYYLSRSSDY